MLKPCHAIIALPEGTALKRSGAKQRWVVALAFFRLLAAIKRSLEMAIYRTCPLK
jgi:hypothetical protein